ncbi:uncharacterized protein [Pseudochaenichthys georgianus]|uniref:uncharacterized protein n=1 Tax=Pseudochaenichthys georgianus TaxID=52239 RepID=UPI0039C2ED4C
MKNSFLMGGSVTTPPHHVGCRLVVCDCRFQLQLSDEAHLVKQDIGAQPVTNKTELLLIGSKSTLSKTPNLTLTIDGTPVSPSTQARNLGVIFDPTLSLDSHIRQVVKISFFHLRNIAKIRPYLTRPAAERLIHAFISSRLDYYAPKPPSVSVSPSAEIEEGSPVTLTCSSDANPAANYTWYKEDSPKASGQIFNITEFRAEHRGSYSCGAQNKLGRSDSTLTLSVGTGGSWKLPAAATITVVLLAVIALSVFLGIRRKRASRDSPEPEERADTREEPEQQDDLQYASVPFSNSRADPLYSNMRAARPLGHTEQQDVPEYAAIKFSSAAPRTRGQDSGEDPAAFYSTVNKSH